MYTHIQLPACSTLLRLGQRLRGLGVEGCGLRAGNKRCFERRHSLRYSLSSVAPSLTRYGKYQVIRVIILGVQVRDYARALHDLLYIICVYRSVPPVRCFTGSAAYSGIGSERRRVLLPYCECNVRCLRAVCPYLIGDLSDRPRPHCDCSQQVSHTKHIVLQFAGDRSSVRDAGDYLRHLTRHRLPTCI